MLMHNRVGISVTLGAGAKQGMVLRGRRGFPRCTGQPLKP